MERNNPYIAPCSFMVENRMITDNLVEFVLWTEQTMKRLEEGIKSITKLDKTHSNIRLLKHDCIKDIQRQFDWYMTEVKWDINVNALVVAVYDFIVTFQSIPTYASCYLIDNCTDSNLNILLPMVERVQNEHLVERIQNEL